MSMLNIRITTELEKPEKASLKEHIPVSVKARHPSAAATQVFSQFVTNSTTQAASIIIAVISSLINPVNIFPLLSREPGVSSPFHDAGLFDRYSAVVYIFKRTKKLTYIAICLHIAYTNGGADALTTRQILFFVTLARCGSFTKAADELFITQPGLSYAVKQLESELGVPLFSRNDKGASLTRYGEAFLPYAERVINTINEAVGLIDGLKNPLSGNVNVVCIVTFTADVIPDILRDFYKGGERKAIDVRLTAVQTSAEVSAQLKSGKADISFGYDAPENAESVRVCEQELVLAVPRGHRFSWLERVSLSEIGDEPMIFCTNGSQLYEQTEKMFRHDGLKPNIKFCTRDCSAMTAYASLGIGLSVVPHAAAAQNAGVHICRIDNPYRVRGIYMSRLKSRSLPYAAQYFFDFCRERYGSSG